VQLTYPWLRAECAKCNTEAPHATTAVLITIPPDWVAPANRVFRDSCPYEVGAGMAVTVQLPGEAGYVRRRGRTNVPAELARNCDC
jgi:hypothetical protein